MNIIPYCFSLRSLGFAATLALFTPALRAQTAPMSPPTAPTTTASTESPVDMNEDLQSLMRQVGELRLHVESLQQDNEEMKKRIPTSEEIKTLMQNLIAANRAEMDKDLEKHLTQVNDDTRKEILADVSKQMEALARETNIQLDKLAHAIGNAPAPHPVSVTSMNSSTAPKFDHGIDYTVKHGDTLAKICIANHVSSRDLILANPQLNGNGNLIREGQHLFLPQRDGAPAPHEGAPSTTPATVTATTPTASTTSSAPPSTGAVLNFPGQ